MDWASLRWTIAGWVGIAAATFTLAVGRDATPSLPLTSPAAASTRIWHEDALTLTVGRGADLDAPAYDDQWGPSDRNGPGTAFDVTYGPEGFRRADWAFGTTLVPAPSTVGGAGVCATATGYGAATIPRDELVRGARICVRTGNGRVALVDVVSTTPTTGTFYVTTFAALDDVLTT
ncbi:hypothetical protein [Cryptosporangium sp. NPDC048952]|uniref:hypothetical protein n=1 Tax=Cryptosporangium sp. NPDC048952 TaxID=3363961 RepID=UPI003719391E